MLQDTITLISGSDIVNATIETGTSDPSSATVGRLFYRTDLTELRIYNGTSWVSASGASGVTSLTGTTNEISVSSSTGAVTLSLPQAIGTTSTPTFAELTITGTPTNTTDAATKAYVDSVAAGLSWKQPAVLATTANLTGTYVGSPTFTLTNSGTQAALSLDGLVPTVGQRVLLKNQTTQSQNGIYLVTNVGSNSTNWVLTRTTDFNEVTPINEVNGAAIYVTGGSTQANTGWTQIDNVTTFDSSNIAWAQFSGVGSGVASLSAGTGISVSQPTGVVTITNTGVTSIVAGTNVTVSGGTGAVTINATAPAPALATTQIAYGNSSNTLSGSADLTWSGANDTNPTYTLTLGTATASPTIQAAASTTVASTLTIYGSSASGQNGGAIAIIGGNAPSSSNLTGGSVTILGGGSAGSPASGTFYNGGAVSIIGGTGHANNASSIGGSVTLQSGAAFATGGSAIPGQLIFSIGSTLNFTINASGAWGLGTSNNVGTTGQVLTANSAGTPTWASVPAASAGTLTGTTLASNVVNSSLTSVGTLTNLTVSGTTNTAAIVATGAVSTNATTLDSTSTASASLTAATAYAIDTVTTTTFRTIKYIIQVSEGTTAYHSVEVLVLQDGTTCYKTEYGAVYSSGSLGTFDATISGTTMTLYFTPAASATYAIKVSKLQVTV